MCSKKTFIRCLPLCKYHSSKVWFLENSKTIETARLVELQQLYVGCALFDYVCRHNEDLEVVVVKERHWKLIISGIELFDVFIRIVM